MAEPEEMVAPNGEYLPLPSLGRRRRVCTAHVWAAKTRPGGTLTIEVCIRCHEPNWARLDEEIRKLLTVFSNKVVEVFQDRLLEAGD